jgi:hypothetical protein
MPDERRAEAAGGRQAPLATPFGRLARDRGTTRGVTLSAAVHLAVVALLLWAGSRLPESGQAPGPGHGRGGGGGGGGARTLVLYVPPTAQPPLPAVTPPLHQLVVPVPRVTLPPVRTDSVPLRAAALAAAQLGPGAGPGAGTGKGPGTGSGSGGGTGSGRGPGLGPDSGGGGGSFYPPQLLSVIMPPPHPPGSVRGSTVTAVFEVSASGRVVRVTLHPTPRDRRYADELLARLRTYAFTPARTLDGQPMPALFRVNITLY